MQFQHQRFWLKRGGSGTFPASPVPTEVDQLKRDIKEWEHEFQKKHGRKPNKEDVDKVPEIRKKYKKHAAMKQKSPVASSKKQRHDEKNQKAENSEDEADESWAHREPLPDAYVSCTRES